MSHKIYIKKFDGSMPSKANVEDAGYDIVATSDPKIVGSVITIDANTLVYKNIQYIEYETNLSIAPDPSTQVAEGVFVRSRIHTLCFPRSSISSKNLILANSIGLVDQGYRNQILFRFKYIFQPEDLIINPSHNINAVLGLVNFNKIYQRGDRIGQLVFTNTVDANFELVEELPLSNRGLGGFGSSGI